MSDRELLELAAKAAGVFLTPQTMAEVFPGFEWNEGDWTIFTDHGAEGTVAWKGEDGKPAGTARKHWNPLTDDGDALRLAVSLGIKVVPYPIFGHEKHCVIASRRWWSPPEDDDNTYIGPEVIEVYGDDPYAATRRAIVRAAAEIGRAM